MPSVLTAISDLSAYIASDGPFDGVMAFSQGACIAGMLLARAAQRKAPPPFRCAVFFSGLKPADPEALERGEIKVLGEEVGEEEEEESNEGVRVRGLIQIPTAHVWGGRDDDGMYGKGLSELCAAEKRVVYVWPEGGHEIPGAKAPEVVRRVVGMIRKTVERAEMEGR